MILHWMLSNSPIFLFLLSAAVLVAYGITRGVQLLVRGGRDPG